MLEIILLSLVNYRIPQTVTVAINSLFQIQVANMVLSPKAYIEQSLGTWLLSDPEFNNKYEVVSTAANTSEHLDGFMATIFMCDVVLQSRENGE